MALKISTKADNGVVTSYHRLTLINVQPNQEVVLSVLSYIDEDGRNYEKDYEAGNIVGEPTFPFTDGEYYSIPWAEALPLLKGDLFQNMYDWLKQQPKFSGAEDI